ncbi:MAG TPA: hypothetical protein PKZ12_06235 [Smithellaceae bacterium]|nr:hypothetical protein [Smithellaceae bacterium]
MDKVEDIQKINKEIAVKINKIEKRLAPVRKIRELFEELFAGIESEFAIPFVWLTLIESEKAAPVIAAVKSSEKLKNRLNIVSADLFAQVLPSGDKPVLANKDLQPYYRLLPPSNKYFIKSLAIVPFKIGNDVVGSWNNGDAVSERYLPDMETDLVRKLSAYVSGRLTEMNK